jgi:peptide deformylase
MRIDEKIQVIKLGSELLRQKALPVRDIDESAETLCAVMLATLHKHKGVGLAGPQVGQLKRLFVIHIEKDIPRVFINPSIIGTSEHTGKYEEGCLSLPGVYEDVIRPGAVRVQAWNEKGKPFTLEAEGLLARVIQHEYDHLEGLLFIDHLSEVKRERLLAKYEKLKARPLKKR